jgi:hypothetical protein
VAAGTGPDRLTLSGMTATSWGTGRLDLFSTDARVHGLLHTWYTGRWNGPEHLDFGGTAAPVMADASPRAAPLPVNPLIRELGSDD